MLPPGQIGRTAGRYGTVGSGGSGGEPGSGHGTGGSSARAAGAAARTSVARRSTARRIVARLIDRAFSRDTGDARWFPGTGARETASEPGRTTRRRSGRPGPPAHACGRRASQRRWRRPGASGGPSSAAQERPSSCVIQTAVEVTSTAKRGSARTVSTATGRPAGSAVGRRRPFGSTTSASRPCTAIQTAELVAARITGDRRQRPEPPPVEAAVARRDQLPVDDAVQQLRVTGNRGQVRRRRRDPAPAADRRPCCARCTSCPSR